jgi:hypothetical protein
VVLAWLAELDADPERVTLTAEPSRSATRSGAPALD